LKKEAGDNCESFHSIPFAKGKIRTSSSFTSLFGSPYICLFCQFMFVYFSFIHVLFGYHVFSVHSCFVFFAFSIRSRLYFFFNHSCLFCYHVFSVHSCLLLLEILEVELNAQVGKNLLQLQNDSLLQLSFLVYVSFSQHFLILIFVHVYFSIMFVCVYFPFRMCYFSFMFDCFFFLFKLPVISKRQTIKSDNCLSSETKRRSHFFSILLLFLETRTGTEILILCLCLCLCLFNFSFNHSCLFFMFMFVCFFKPIWIRNGSFRTPI